MSDELSKLIPHYLAIQASASPKYWIYVIETIATGSVCHNPQLLSRPPTPPVKLFVLSLLDLD